jgi:hypothetical protein
VLRAPLRDLGGKYIKMPIFAVRSFTIFLESGIVQKSISKKMD